MYHQAQEKIIGVKELRTRLPKIVNAIRRGQHFLVMRRHEPLFRLQPINGRGRRKYTLADLKDAQWRDPKGDRDLSKHIDEIVYGI